MQIFAPFHHFFMFIRYISWMRILVMEDDPKIAASLARTLSAESYAVDVARDGVAGEELARVNDYDLIILDILLPRQDGWQTCAHLHRDDIQTPILMLTALVDVENTIRGLDQGAPSARVEIRDTGFGIWAADLPHIFKRFYRPATARGEGSGSGLGLAIVEQIVKMHGGTVAARSTPGQGSAFIVELPL
jgi:CheY-like chemotaxis protein